MLPARPEMSGNYDVVVSTDYGSVTSRVASVRIRAAPVADAQQLEFGGWADLRQVTKRYELAQTFTARISGRLERVFQGGGFSEPAREYPTIFSITDTVADEPGTSVLGSVVVQHLAGGEVVSFHDKDVYLEANHRYALLIQTDAGSTLGATYSFPTSGRDAYPDGELWVRSPPASKWTRFGPVDLSFATCCFPGIPDVRITQLRNGALLEIGKPIVLEALMAPDFVCRRDKEPFHRLSSPRLRGSSSVAEERKGKGGEDVSENPVGLRWFGGS